MVHITCGQVDERGEWLSQCDKSTPVHDLVYQTTGAMGYRTPPVGLGRIVAENEWVGISTTILGHAPLLNPETCCMWLEVFLCVCDSLSWCRGGKGDEHLDGDLPVYGEG